jgi:hypothetical protein
MTTPEVPDSPLTALLSALSRRDADAAEALCSPDCRLSTADGRRAQGRQPVRVLLGQFLADLRSASYQVTSQWHQDGMWFAEVLATYELRDWLLLERLPRAFVVEAGAEGISAMRVYGANERPLTDYRTADESPRVGGHLLLPL